MTHKLEYRDDGTILKTFDYPQEHITDEWFEHYKMYRQTYRNTVEVHEYSTKHIVMENIEGNILDLDMFYYVPVTDKLHKEFHYVQKQIYDILSSFYEYFMNHGVAFYHIDMTESNLIVTNNKKLILIDPDSFHVDQFVDYTRMWQIGYFREASLYARKLRDKFHDNNE